MVPEVMRKQVAVQSAEPSDGRLQGESPIPSNCTKGRGVPSCTACFGKIFALVLSSSGPLQRWNGRARSSVVGSLGLGLPGLKTEQSTPLGP